MTRKVLLGIPVLAGLSLGQMCGAPAPQPFDRLAVNDGLRAACPGLADPFISTMITTAENMRVVGVPKNEAISSSVEGCSGTHAAALCLQCGMAVLNQVYGK